MVKAYFSKPQNRLLAALPLNEYEILRPHLKQISLSQGREVYKAKERIEEIIFPNTGAISLLVKNEDASLDVALVGYEGMVGFPVLLFDESSPYTAIVQIPGTALSIDADVMKRELDNCPA